MVFCIVGAFIKSVRFVHHTLLDVEADGACIDIDQSGKLVECVAFFSFHTVIMSYILLNIALVQSVVMEAVDQVEVFTTAQTLRYSKPIFIILPS